jgi:ribonuclease Y
MSTISIILGVAGILVGLGLGYYLRLLVSLSKMGSMELEIKQKMVEAKEEAQKIVSDATAKADEKIKTLESEEKIRLEDIKKLEERLLRKEDSIEAKEKDIQKSTEERNKKSAGIREHWKSSALDI